MYYLYILHTSAIYDLHIFLTSHGVLGCLISKSKCNLLCANVPDLLSVGRATLADSVTKPASPDHKIFHSCIAEKEIRDYIFTIKYM